MIREKFKPTEKGFTLIEMAVVMIIVGIVISTMVTVLPSLLQTAKHREAKAQLEKIDYALQGYAIANNRLPFADTNGDGTEDVGYVGDIPYLTIGLSSGEDTWGNPIRYAVYGEAGGTANLTDPPDANAFCTAISAADVLGFNASIAYTTNDDAACTAVDTNASNQAYIIASGGTKDQGGTPGFFDGCNGTGVGFNAVNKRPAPDYDDIVKSLSLGELNRIICTGTGGSGSGGGSATPPGVENTDTLCGDGIDNDSDGKIDCQDQDCCSTSVSVCSSGCPPPDAVAIVTVPDPLPTVKSGDSSFNHSFQATGGSGNYFWYLDGISPPINGVSIDLWTGILSGTLDNCEGTYTIEIRVEDRNDGTLTDTHTFTLEVEPSVLNIIPEPSGVPDFSVTGSVFETFFEANELDGGHVGGIVWSVAWQTDDPGGFQIDPTSEGGRDSAISAKFWKSGTVTGGAGTYTFTMSATDATCATNTITSNSYSLEITESGLGSPYSADLVAEWHLDECLWDGTPGEVEDSGTNSLNGVALNGALTAGAGKICGAGFFDGSNDTVSIDSTEDLKLTTEFSISLWVKLNRTHTNWARLVGKGDSPNRNYGVWIVPSSNRILFQIQHSGGTANLYSTSSVNDGKWHHVVCVYDLSTIKVFIDNTEEASTAFTQTPNTNDAPLTIGGTSGYYVNGYIDEVMLFNKALPSTSDTESSVESIFELTRTSCAGECYTDPVSEYKMENFPWTGSENEVIDSGSAGNNGKTAARGTGNLPTHTLPSEGKVCRSGIFERIDYTNGGYLDLGDPPDGSFDPGTSPWTISAWINWDGISNNYTILYNKENLYEAAINDGYFVYAWQPHWSWDGGTSFPVTANTWTYATTVYDGRRQTLYKDGIEVFSRPQTGAIGQNTSKFLLAGRGDTTAYSFFGGELDNVTIYNRALSESEILSDMNKTQNCAADSVVISTTALADAIMGSAYITVLTASGGSAPYAWEIITNPFSGISLDSFSGSTVNLTGNITECSGIYDITIKVTDNNSRIDQRTFTLTVNNGILAISPSSGQTYTVTNSAFYQDFVITGPRVGAMENWSILWQGTNPGGFEIVGIGDNTARVRKSGPSTAGNGYLFRISARDAACNDYDFTSETYILNLSGAGEDTPYYLGMVGEWNLDECDWDGTADEILDSSGNAAHGRSYNMAAGDSPERAVGKICKAAAINLGATTNQYIGLGNGSFQNLDDFSLSMWFRVEDLSSSFSTLFSGSGGGNHNAMILILNATGTQVTGYINGAATSTFNLGAADPDDGLWHHLVWVRNSVSGEANLYIDGVSVDTDTTVTTTVSLDAGGVIIGQEQDRFGGGFDANQCFQGWIDEIRIYNRVLDASDVTTLYQLDHDCSGSCYTDAVAEYRMDETSWNGSAGDVKDTSGNDLHATSNGTVAINTTDTQLCNSGEFLGAGANYINSGTLPISTSAGDKTTVSFWMKWTGTNAQMPVGWDTQYDLYIHNNYFGFNTGGGDLYGVDISGGSLLNTWRHVAAIFTNNVASPEENLLYIDGVLQPSASRAGGTFNSKSVSSTLYISGWDTGTTYKFGGLIDELRVYNRALSESEIKKDKVLTHGCPDGP